MPSRPLIALVFAACAFMCATAAQARKTVCTITVNSADEKETFKKRLPAGDYDFVELLERGRPDWLATSCRKGVQCDVLIVSGHFNAGDDFYSDQIDNGAYLRVDELERASCSDSCPGLFANLKEVHLYGCESLNPNAGHNGSGESSRERMRRVFANVPAIYGFAGPAPVGPTAAMLLNKSFDAGLGREIATGRASSKLLSTFAKNNMSSTAGLRPGDRAYAGRAQVCRFFDDRISGAAKLRFVHDTMRRDVHAARGFLLRTEKLLASLDEADRQAPAFAQALAEFSADDATRDRFLALARSDPPALRARMVALASTLGWLAPEQWRAEQAALVQDLVGAKMGFADVELVCSMNATRALDGLDRLVRLPAGRPSVEQSAAMACLGNQAAHHQVLRALASPSESDVQAAQAYLRHRPPTDVAEVRALAREIGRMPSSGAQVRALETLARLRISDPEVLEELGNGFAIAKSLQVQRAIAEVFIRSDPKAIDRPEMVALIHKHRLRAPGGSEDLIDVLMRQLQGS